MGHTLTVVSSTFVERIAHDPRISDAARRAARKELARRSREAVGRCPNRGRCTNWDCEGAH